MLESLEPAALRQVLRDLFPDGEELPRIDWQARWGWSWSNELAVTVEEVQAALASKKRKLDSAPGPDGLGLRFWRRVPHIMLLRLADCFSRCLEEGIFPARWKVARLVLLPKGETTAGLLPKVRPICLLDESGKALERIIAARMRAFLSADPAIDIAPNQFGFRRGRSTADALLAVKKVVKDALGTGRVVLAIALDIANAFNGIPWRAIRRQVRWRKRFPIDICRIVDGYLSNRWVEFITGEGGRCRYQVRAGVPQGSVLRPLLWNITYDDVVRMETFRGCLLVCYADDTLVLVVANNVEAACDLANNQLRRVVECIDALGLRIAHEKANAVMFSRCGRIGEPKIRVGRAVIEMANQMRYLGVILDSRLTFLPHFEYVEAKAARAMRSLGRLMPNLRGSSEGKRKLYANVLISILLYGAPVWADEFCASRLRQQGFRRLHRSIAARVVSAYRTVSYDAVCVLARMPPIKLLVENHKRIFRKISELKNEGHWSLPAVNLVRVAEEAHLRDEWRAYLRRQPTTGARTKDAIVPCLSEWLDRAHGGLSFRLTQLLTGHGCFRVFLQRIRKADDPACVHCESGAGDDPEHTIQICPAWSQERAELCASLGRRADLTLRGIVDAIVRDPEVWSAFATFAERVLRVKEEAERRREAEVVANVRAMHGEAETSGEED